MNTLEAIAARYSCREYTSEQITEAELNTILSAAGAAPNAAPHGTAHFSSMKLIVVQSPEMLKRMDDTMPGDLPTHGAPTVIIVSAIPEKGFGNELAMCNTGCIMENMAIAAADLGLASCYLFGVVRPIRDNRDLCRTLHIPDDFEPCSILAVGHAASAQPSKVLRPDQMGRSAAPVICLIFCYLPLESEG